MTSEKTADIPESFLIKSTNGYKHIAAATNDHNTFVGK
jgi:hypothetical protein